MYIYIYIYIYIYMYVYMYIYIAYVHISRHVCLPAAPRAALPVPSAVTRELAHPAPGIYIYIHIYIYTYGAALLARCEAAFQASKNKPL